MQYRLNIMGLFRDEEDLRATIRKRKMCYDIEPYYLPNKQGSLTQIGFQINLYGAFPDTAEELSAKRQAFGDVLRDVRSVAEALQKTGEALHMGELVVPDSTSVSISAERKRPDVTVHIPVFDQEHFGRPVDERISRAIALAGEILQQAGVQKNRWHD
jgi:hypothetical protein